MPDPNAVTERLNEIYARQPSGVDPALLAAQMRTLDQSDWSIDTETLELLQAWAIEDATDDPEKLRAAQQELDDFKKAMNGTRAACGGRILYP
jgi:hypothetical protein